MFLRLELREIYCIFNKLTCFALIITVTDSLMQLIFIGYGVLQQIINEPVSTRHLDYHKLTKFLILITS